MLLPLNDPSILLSLTLIVGMIIGSFLNVLIARYPIMLERSWREECLAFLNLPQEPTQPFNLLTPRSHCPHCKTSIKWYQNIPILSYCLLRGRCAHCKHSISPRYPFVELLTAILSALVVIEFSLSWQAFAALLLTWNLIALSFIDFKTQLLPDGLTLPGLWIGLLLSIFAIFSTPTQAILGATLGYILPWVTATLFKWIRKKEGMGHGDFKLLAMLGAWFGPAMVLNIIFIAVFLALFTSSILLVTKKINTREPIPFGPFIAMAGWVSLFTGPILINYLLLK